MSKGLEVRDHIVLLGDDGWSFLGKASGGRKRLAWEGLCHSRSCDEAWQEHSFLSSFTPSALINSLYKHGSATQQIRKSWRGWGRGRKFGQRHPRTDLCLDFERAIEEHSY